jgi:hypothetical protein
VGGQGRERERLVAGDPRVREGEGEEDGVISALSPAARQRISKEGPGSRRVRETGTREIKQETFIHHSRGRRTFYAATVTGSVFGFSVGPSMLNTSIGASHLMTITIFH